MTGKIRKPLGLKKPLATALAAVTTAATFAHAQDDDGGLSALLLEEVVVTAQKRDENISEVPVAVTSLDSRLLEAQGITTPGDLSRIVPNMALADYQGEVRIAIRGVGQLVQTANPGVAIHSDGVYQPRASMASLLQLDMGGVEVLRGPQGTVYGRNANGGAINYTSKEAGDEFGGHIKVGYAEYDETRLQVAFDAPITDSLRARLTIDQWERGEGFIENVGDGRDGQEGEILSGRLRIDADFSETVLGTLIVNYADSEGTFPALSSTPIGPNAPDPRFSIPAFGPLNDGSLDFREISQNFDSIQDREYISVAGTLNWEINDTFSFKSITAFQTFEDFQSLDVDSTNAPIVTSTVDQEADTFTQEFNLNFTTDRFSGVIGAFYLNDELSGSNFLPFGSVQVGPPTAPPAGGFFPNTPAIPANAYSRAVWDPLETTSTALFADATFDVTDSLSIIAGVRFSREELDLNQIGGFSGPDGSVPFLPLDGRRDFFPPDEPNNACNFEPEELGTVIDGEVATYNNYQEDVDTFTPKLGLRYAVTEDSNVYATYSEGFKAGGVSVRSGCDNSFDEETVTAYEIGSKNVFADGRLRLNVTGYYYDYEGYQIEQLVGLTFVLDNVEEAEVMGLEIEATAVLTDSFSIIANASLQDSEITSHTATDGINYVVPNEDGFPGAGPTALTARPFIPLENEDVSGNPLPNAPEATLNLSFNYDLNENFTFQVGAAYTGDTNFREFDRAADGQDAYTLYNANISWTSDDESINVRIYGNNLTDEEYRLFAAANQLTDNRLFSIGAPRQVGAELTYNF
jgi:iron complex outermembrane receptor protein